MRMKEKQQTMTHLKLAPSKLMSDMNTENPGYFVT